jgi:hypothetical protein
MSSNQKLMKRLLLSGLALMLVMSTSGQVFAAAFCPRSSGHECCFAKTISDTHRSSSSHERMAGHHMHMDGMSMGGMKMNDMQVVETSMDHMAMNDMTIGGATVDMSIPFSRPASSKQAVANKFDQPFESCAHCVGHSGVANAPVSFVSVSGQSGKDVGSVLLPVSRFLARAPLALAQVGLPGEHAPPGTSAPRHILISVFLI